MENLQPQPEPQPGPALAGDPLPPTSTDDDATIGFTPLEGEEASFSDLPPEPEPVIPFTGEELVQAATWVLLLGVRPQTEEEARAFTEAFQRGVLPMLPPAAVLNYLKVGEALAQYGIGRNRLPGMGGLDQLPPWLRILLGGVVVGMSAYGGIRALLDLRAARTANPAPAGGVANGRAYGTAGTA